MNFKRILYATDFSHSSDAALGFASALAAEANARLDIVHVSAPTASYYAGYGSFAYTPELGDEMVRQNRERLAKIKPTVAGVDYEHHDLRGIAAEQILEHANREGVDLIVVGTHGRTGIARTLMGSIAEEIVRKAKCPVLTAKTPATAASESAE